MCSTTTNAFAGVDRNSRSHEEEDLVFNATAWQLPPDGDSCCSNVATPRGIDSTQSGTDECQIFTTLSSSSQCSEVCSSDDADARRCSGRPRSSSWPDYSYQAPLLRSNSEGEIKSRSPNRAFLSLMLPEWVHQKAEEDEASGEFPCRSTVSPLFSSPASSPATSPQAPPKAESYTVPVRRSGVNWADLSDSEEDDSLTGYAWSTASTADSSPAGVGRGSELNIGKNILDDTVDPVDPGEDFNSPEGVKHTSFAVAGLSGRHNVNNKSTARSTMRWVDLMESDIDPVFYKWSEQAHTLEDGSSSPEGNGRGGHKEQDACTGASGQGATVTEVFESVARSHQELLVEAHDEIAADNEHGQSPSSSRELVGSTCIMAW